MKEDKFITAEEAKANADAYWEKQRQENEAIAKEMVAKFCETIDRVSCNEGSRKIELQSCYGKDVNPIIEKILTELHFKVARNVNRFIIEWQ
jgi:hypothetical protein